VSEKNGKEASPATRLDGGFWLLVVLAVASVMAAVAIKGSGALLEGALVVLDDLLLIVPQIVLGVSVGALFSVLLPKAVVARHLGEQSGLRGLVIAEILGALMPGGPVTSFPLVIALARSGAGLGPLMSFLVAWEAIGLHRMMVWELPFMGSDFALLRFLCSFPLPILSGLLAIWIAARFPRFRPDLSQ
jgi:uncharacterized membrane protein YraQ (UPF0718 family)